MTHHWTPEQRRQAMLDLIEDAEALSREIPQSEIDEITRLGREHPLPRERGVPFMARLAAAIGIEDPQGWAERLYDEREAAG